MSTFDSTKRLLPDILGDIVKGNIQLPDFQRGWIWDDAHVRSLLVSIARSFPVGAVMLLETGGEARFQVRPVENVPFAGTPPHAELLILDGQQRLTTLTAVETRMANDVEELIGWIEQETEQPRTIVAAAFQPDRLDRLTSRLSAAYKGIHVLVLRAGAADFFWKANISELDAEDVALDIHHIFPQDWCEKQGILRKHYNAIVNKTPISYKANRMIGGAAPSHYLQRLQNHKQVQLGDAGMDSILESHLIAAHALRTDDFQTFYTLRKQALLTLIAGAMGKPVMLVNTYEESDEGEEPTGWREERAFGEYAE